MRESHTKKSRYQTSFKMKFIVETVFMLVYLVVDVHSASAAYSISNEALTVHGTADVHLNISIEQVWDSLSQGMKY